MRKLVTLGIAVALVGGGGVAEAKELGKTYRRNRGKIAFQAEPFGTFSTEAEFGAHVAKVRRNKTLPRDKKGNWTIHFIAFMSANPGATKVNLVWYKTGRKREQVDFTEFVVPADERTLQATSTVVPAVGFKPGDKVELRVTRIVRGKEKVYARCKLTLR